MENCHQIRSWLIKAMNNKKTVARTDLDTNSGGLGGSDMEVSGPLSDGMGYLFSGGKKTNVRKKKQRRIDERPGEQKVDKV